MQVVECKCVASQKNFLHDVEMAENEARKTIQIIVSVHSRFAAACERRAIGRSMGDTANRLLDWFTRQPEYIQTAVLADVDKGMENAYADALQRMADGLRLPSVTEDDVDSIEPPPPDDSIPPPPAGRPDQSRPAARRRPNRA